MKFFLGLATALGFIAMIDPACAAGTGAGGYSNSSAETCMPSNIQLCGINFALPATQQGSVLSVTLPERFMTNSVSLQCASNYGVPPSFHLLNAEMLNCAMRICNPTSLMICGNSVSIATAASVGDVIQVPFSLNLVINDAPTPPVFNARCAVVNGEAHYVADDADSISCNLFLCQPTRLDICSSRLVINDTARLGAVGQVTTESGQPVTVECLGSVGRAPQFQVIQHACE